MKRMQKYPMVSEGRGNIKVSVFWRKKGEEGKEIHSSFHLKDSLSVRDGSFFYTFLLENIKIHSTSLRDYASKKMAGEHIWVINPADDLKALEFYTKMFEYFFVYPYDIKFYFDEKARSMIIK